MSEHEVTHTPEGKVKFYFPKEKSVNVVTDKLPERAKQAVGLFTDSWSSSVLLVPNEGKTGNQILICRGMRGYEEKQAPTEKKLARREAFYVDSVDTLKTVSKTFKALSQLQNETPDMEIMKEVLIKGNVSLSLEDVGSKDTPNYEVFAEISSRDGLTGSLDLGTLEEFDTAFELLEGMTPKKK